MIDYSAIRNSTVNAKGDLIAGVADNAVGNVSVGSDGSVLTADSSVATGLKWQSVGNLLPKNPAIHAASISPWRATTESTLAQIEALGSNAVTLSIKAESSVTGTPANTITVSSGEWTWAESMYNAVGDRIVILELYPWLDNGDGLETEWNPPNVNTWFANWEALLLEAVSRFPDAYGIYIASNLVYLEQHHDKWATLIANIRAVTDMQIFMRTNWRTTTREVPSSFAPYNAKLANPTFGLIDVLAIAWYFELCETTNPTLDELKDVMQYGTTIPYGIYARDQLILDQVQALSETHDVPIFAGELVVGRNGRSTNAPWSNTIGTTYGTSRDRQIQRRYFQAWMETIGTQPWCLGYSVFGVGYAWPNDNEYTLDPNAVRYLANAASHGRAVRRKHAL